jgi:RNA polymerase sigma-70 factor (ECF subfamily)
LEISLADLLFREKLLVRRFNKGDADALQSIYDRHKEDLMTLAVALLFDKALAEDVIHDVFARLLSRHCPISIRTSLKGYLMSAVANRARNMNRTGSKRVSVTLDETLGCQGHVDLPERSLIRTEEQVQLVQALKQLPYKQREVILLRHFGRMKFQAIANCRDVSMSTVHGQYRYGMEKLRSLLRGDL